MHAAAMIGQFVLFNKIFEIEGEKNPKNKAGETPFHLVCQYGHTKIADMLIQVVKLNFCFNNVVRKMVQKGAFKNYFDQNLSYSDHLSI